MTTAKSYQKAPTLLKQPPVSYAPFGKVGHKFNSWTISIETVAKEQETDSNVHLCIKCNTLLWFFTHWNTYMQ